jgi:GT2 family glycosyltransferase
MLRRTGFELIFHCHATFALGAAFRIIEEWIMHEDRQSGPNIGTVRLLAVVVLYKQKPSDSSTLNSLRLAISRLDAGQADIRIVLYDNTPGGQDTLDLPPDVHYKADIENGGLAKAYNYALEIAHQDGYDWMLTLDQDTSLPIDFMSKLCCTITLVTPLNVVAGIVPSIFSDGRLISPSAPILHWAYAKHFPDNFTGISPHDLTLAVNSASTLRVRALRAAGGYDPRFWLDYCDVVMFYRLQANHQRIFVAGNIHVEHEASVLDLMNRTTPARYENIYVAAEAFSDEYLGRTEHAVQVLKLFYQLCRLCWDRVSLPYIEVVFRFLCRRLFHSRKHRIENWKHSVELRSKTGGVSAPKRYLNAES